METQGNIKKDRVARLSCEVVDAVRAHGEGWESLDRILRRVLEMPEREEKLSIIDAFPIKTLGLDEHVEIPWPKQAGGLADEKAVARIRRSVINYAQKSGRRYRFTGMPSGLKVTRVL